MTEYNYNVHNKCFENLSTGSKFGIDAHRFKNLNRHTYTHTYLRAQTHNDRTVSLFFKKTKQTNKNHPYFRHCISLSFTSVCLIYFMNRAAGTVYLFCQLPQK
jgi:hypothetical protein